jgi:uncharacterized surface protein with fasciclin (FAS1) repeats
MFAKVTLALCALVGICSSAAVKSRQTCQTVCCRKHTSMLAHHFAANVLICMIKIMHVNLNSCDERDAPTSQIAEIAASNPDFSTLVTALTAADLAGPLGDKAFGPVTVFAPTNKVTRVHIL